MKYTEVKYSQPARQWLLAPEAQVQSKIISSDIHDRQGNTGMFFSEFFSFPCSSSFLQPSMLMLMRSVTLISDLCIYITGLWVEII